MLASDLPVRQDKAQELSQVPLFWPFPVAEDVEWLQYLMWTPYLMLRVDWNCEMSSNQVLVTDLEGRTKLHACC